MTSIQDTLPAATDVSLGRLLAQRLFDAGVRRAYGFPGGGSNLDLVEAFTDAGIAWILSHTEVGAAFMACADAEINRVPGVLVVGNGPGLASAVNGVAHAWLDRVPLVVISDRYTETEAATTGHQIVDQRGLLAPVVKFSATLEADGAASVLDQALEACSTGRCGPVHLDMPRDVASRPTATGAPVAPSAGAAAAPSDLADVAAELLAARRPVLLVGLEANDGVDPDDLTTIARCSGAAVLTTYKAKGTFPEADPRWAGILTGAEIERPVLEQADLMLAVGLDAVELLARPWPYDARVLSLARTELTDEYLRPAVRLVGPVAPAVAGLAGALRGHARSDGFAESEVTDLRESALSSLRFDEEEPLPGWRIVETAISVLPADTTFSVDAGAHMFPATMFARPRGPNRFLISNGLATMGFAVPSAIGAALARPDRLSVAFTGDGGMAYHAHELETAVRLGAKVVVVVFNDSSLSLIRIKQEAKGYTRSPLDFGLTRFAPIARGLGVHGVEVDDEAGLRLALADAVRREGGSVIDVRTTGAEMARTLTAVRG